MNVDPRPDLTPALEALLLDLASHVGAFAGIEPSRILVVGLAAHGGVAASVRPLSGVAREVIVAGHARSIELGLRPVFFLDGDASRRLTTLVHELLHLDPADPTRLLDEHRHQHRGHAEHDAEARALADEWLKRSDPLRLLCLAHDGEVLLRQWRRRPFDSTHRDMFTDEDVFAGPVLMRTPVGARGGWW